VIDRKATKKKYGYSYNNPGLVAYQRHRISPETVVWKLRERLFDAPAKVTNQIYQ